MNEKNKKGIALAILAAVLYAFNSPFSKILLEYMPPTLMAGFLYLGAGAGMAALALMRKQSRTAAAETKLSSADLPYTIAMIVLDIAAPICLLIGLKSTDAAAASLLNNFEIVATALIALLIFQEKISPRLWLGIVFVTASCLLLSLEDVSSFHLSFGCVMILAACLCWGLENNCTRKLSAKDPLQITLLKGIFSGSGSLIIGICIGESISAWWCVPATMAVGFISYGLSIFTYVYAQRLIGAARTSAYYAVAPFIGVLLSFALFRETPGMAFWAALALMTVGAWLSAGD